MVCSVCGTSNDAEFKFCIKCGSSLENPPEENYATIDKGNYHSEEDYSDTDGGFTMSEGIFVIRDNPAPVQRKKIYTSDELNDSEEEFDFSIYDDPAMATLAPPKQPIQPPPVQQAHMPNMTQQPVYQQPPVQQMGGIPPMPPMPQQMQQMPQSMPQQMQQPMMYAQPQIIGYDPNGMPIYGQPMMYQQPQIMGYDQNGMPVYGQPMMYAQPQIVGYDQNGMPVYGQPPMYGQPQMMGYPPNGMTPYQQPPVQQMGGMPPMPAMPQQMPQAMPQHMQQPEAPKPPKKEEKPDEKQAFWDFFNDGKKDNPPKKEEKDFFGKINADTIDPNDPFADIDNRRKQRLSAKNQGDAVMGNMPVVDGSKLEKNDANKINSLYMRQVNDSVSQDLSITNGEHKQRAMAETQEVDADMLSENFYVKSRISMGYTDDVNADDIEEATTEHREAIMSQADHAVEALPKKVNPYESELDKIELPEYMQAKKTVREETAEIPSLPEL